MKKFLVALILFAVIFPAFIWGWDLKTKENKDEFGDVISKDQYYIDGSWDNKYTDKYIFFFLNQEGDSFSNGYMAFGEQGSKSNETYTATVKIKEQDGTVQTYKCSGRTDSNSSYWRCLISIDKITVQKMIQVLSRNESVKIAVTYGKSSESYNYGSVSCRYFCASPICLRLGHDFDAGTVKFEPICEIAGQKVFTCINCGATQTKLINVLGHNFVNGECTRCAIGHKGQAGGIIFYDCDADNEVGNPDGLKSSECGWQYLEAAPSDITIGGESRFVFGYYRKAPEDDNRYVSGYTKYDESNCTSEEVGSGKKNTELLVKTRGNDAYSESYGSETTSYYAAKLCDDYVYGGYDDWFLPSKEELSLMHYKLGRNGLGNFPSDSASLSGYWSSSESGAISTWVQYFDIRYQPGWNHESSRGEGDHVKENVRAIRAF